MRSAEHSFAQNVEMLAQQKSIRLSYQAGDPFDVARERLEYKYRSQSYGDGTFLG